MESSMLATIGAGSSTSIRVPAAPETWSRSRSQQQPLPAGVATRGSRMVMRFFQG